MQRTAIGITVTAIVLLGCAGTDLAPGEPDPVRQSFERELSHEPSPAATVRRDSIESDELYAIVNSVHWTRSDLKETGDQEAAPGDNDNEQ